MNQAEIKYSATEKECLAVLWAIRKFRPYLECYNFTVITDHIALKWLQNVKTPTGPLARWALELTEYDHEVIYKKGSQNFVPDALSRIIQADRSLASILAASIEKPDTDTKDKTDEWYSTKISQVRERPEEKNTWKIRDGQLYL